jgi:hypothetical protein
MPGLASASKAAKKTETETTSGMKAITTNGPAAPPLNNRPANADGKRDKPDETDDGKARDDMGGIGGGGSGLASIDTAVVLLLALSSLDLWRR